MENLSASAAVPPHQTHNFDDASACFRSLKLDMEGRTAALFWFLTKSAPHRLRRRRPEISRPLQAASFSRSTRSSAAVLCSEVFPSASRRRNYSSSALSSTGYVSTGITLPSVVRSPHLLRANCTPSLRLPGSWLFALRGSSRIPYPFCCFSQLAGRGCRHRRAAHRTLFVLQARPGDALLKTGLPGAFALSSEQGRSFPYFVLRPAVPCRPPVSRRLDAASWSTAPALPWHLAQQFAKMGTLAAGQRKERHSL